MSNCQDTKSMFPLSFWESLKKIPAFRYLKAPVDNVSELYDKYKTGNEKGTFAFVYNENTFYTYHPRGWNRGEWKPIAGGIESFFEIDTEFLKEGDTLVYDSSKKKFVVKSGNVWNNLLDKASSFIQTNRFFNEVEEIPTVESDSGVYFIHKNTEVDNSIIEFRSLYIVLDTLIGKKVVKIWNSSDYYTAKDTQEKLDNKANQTQVDDIAASIDVLAVTKAEKSVVDALMNGIIKQPSVDTYNDTSNGQTSLLNTYPNPEKGWDVLVHKENTRYNWNGSIWVNMETGVYERDKTSRKEIINISQYNLKYNYEDRITARNSVPSDLRDIGQIITYRLDTGEWVTDRFIGGNIVSWGVSTSWLDTTVGEYRNLFSRWQEFTGSWFERMLCVNAVKIYTNNISEKYYVSIVRGTASVTDPVFRIRRYGDTNNTKCSVLSSELTNGVFKGIKAFDESTYAYLDLDFNKIRSTLDWNASTVDNESEMVLTISTATYLNNSINYTDIASIHESYLASSIVSSDEIKISQCIQNLEIHDPTGSNTFRMQQQGFSTSSNKVLFYWLRESDSIQFYQEFAIAKPDSGILHYDYFFNGVRFVFDFNWTLYNSYFTNRYGSAGANRLFAMSKDGRYSNFNDMAISRGMISASVRTEANVNLMLCTSNLKLQSYTSNHIGRFQLRQFGYSTTNGYPIFYVQEISSSVIYEFSVPEETALPTGQRHYDLDNNVLHLSFDFDWDVYAKYFTNRYGFTGIYVMSTLYTPVYNLGKAVSIKSGGKIMLTGASFASDENGWFELFCLKNNLEAVNQSVGGSGIDTNVAQRMLDADETKPHGSLFMVNGVDIFKDVKVFALFHSHNYDVFIRESKYKSNTIDHYKTNGFANRGEVFDYIIKQYRQWCAEYTIELNINGQADVTGGKECNIVLCSHWHKSRSIYNNSSRKIADRYGITYCAFDDNIGFNNDTFVTATLNTDSNTTPVSGLYHQSILHSQFVDISIVGKTEIIDGVMYGWHPQRRSNTVDFGNGQESDGYYYPNIQYMLCGIFGKYLEIIE